MNRFSLAALLGVGCGDEPLAPSQVTGTYVLRSINGNALPAPAGYQGPADELVVVIADTLRLAANRSGSLVRVEKAGSGAGTETRLETALSYETTEGGIAITFDCPSNALMLCIAGPHMTARLGASGLIAIRPLGARQEDLVYVRIEGPD